MTHHPKKPHEGARALYHRCYAEEMDAMSLSEHIKWIRSSSWTCIFTLSAHEGTGHKTAETHRKMTRTEDQSLVNLFFVLVFSPLLISHFLPFSCFFQLPSKPGKPILSSPSSLSTSFSQCHPMSCNREWGREQETQGREILTAEKKSRLPGKCEEESDSKMPHYNLHVLVYIALPHFQNFAAWKKSGYVQISCLLPNRK